MQTNMMSQLSVADLHNYGQRFGIDYVFPCHGIASTNNVIISGQVEELDLISGLRFTHSLLDVLRPYESYSTRKTGLFLLVVLEGTVELTIAGKKYMAQAGMALTTKLGSEAVLHAFHKDKQRLRTITLALDTNQETNSFLNFLDLNKLYFPYNDPAILWLVPSQIFCLLRQFQADPNLCLSQKKLLIEGIALQLLAYGIGQGNHTEKLCLAPKEIKRLEKIYQQFIENPCDDYTIQSLAQEAAMSTSSFRSKFRLMYGQSVFECLRDKRLTKAREFLKKGYTVQQAANFCGYSHASNFSTAFRKRYGISPSNLN